MKRVGFQTVLAQASLCAALLGAPAGYAATLSLDAVDQGWYRNDGIHLSSNQNTLTGQLSNGREYRSFYAFDLSSEPDGDDTQETALTQGDAGRITGATLVFAANNGLARSGDASETLVLYDVTSDPDQLLAGNAGTAGFTDLGDGSQYGSSTYSTPGASIRAVQEVSITLDAAALDDLNQALATGNFEFLVGAVLSTLSGERRSEYLWAWSRLTPAARLDLEIAPIPLPAGLPLLAGALGGLWVLRRRKQAIGPA